MECPVELYCLCYKSRKSIGRNSKKAVEFFSAQVVLNLKEVLQPLAVISRRFDARSKNTDDILDIIKVLNGCEEENISLPRFVIFEPNEVPATLTRQSNELCVKFDSFVDSNPQSCRNRITYYCNYPD